MQNLILSIETSNTNCSVCLADGERVISLKELNGGYTHAENLHVFIQDILKEANIKPFQLNAVAVSKGPGSYTGLRIGVSAAKGLCYALNIPLIGIDTLQAMACAAKSQISNLKSEILFCPMIDARRMEVYCSVYDENLNVKLPVNSLVLDEKSIKVFDFDKPIYFFGDGMPKAKSLLEIIPNSLFIENIFPSAKSLAALAFQKFKQKQFEGVAYFEPFYLKEFFTPVKKN